MEATRLASWLRRFLPGQPTVGWNERVRASVGAFLGLLITFAVTKSVIGDTAAPPSLIAPMGASSFLLFCLPSSPLAQPWPVIGGNVLSALVAVAVVRVIPEPLLAAPLAVGVAIAVMFVCRCLHPPGGAVALFTALAGPSVAAAGFHFALLPVGLNSALLVACAIVLNTLCRRPYPHAQLHVPPTPAVSGEAEPPRAPGITHEDVDAVFARYGEVLDIDPSDMEALFEQLELRVQRRRLGGIRCADIMSRDVVSVPFATPLREAWSLLRSRNLAALPVVGAGMRVMGMVGRDDFLRGATFERADGLRERLRAFLRPPTTSHSTEPEAVGQIMTTPVPTIREDRHFIELVPLMRESGFGHIPVVDERRRLVGMVSQADVIAALYGGGVGAP